MDIKKEKKRKLSLNMMQLSSWTIGNNGLSDADLIADGLDLLVEDLKLHSSEVDVWIREQYVNLLIPLCTTSELKACILKLIYSYTRKSFPNFFTQDIMATLQRERELID